MKNKKQWYKKPGWISIIIVIILFILGLIFSDGGNNININNSTLIDSPIVQDSPNTSISYTTNIVSDSPSQWHNQEIRLESGANLILKREKTGCAFQGVSYNSKIILPSKQEVFLDEIWSNESYVIAYMNNDFSDAYLVNKYRIPEDLNEESICYYMYIDKVGDRMRTEKGPRALNNENSCFEHYGIECYLAG